MEVGKVADLCVVDADLLTLDPHDMPTMPIRMTVLDGEIIFETTELSTTEATIVGGAVGGHYGPSTRLVPLVTGANSCGCEYDSLRLT